MSISINFKLTQAGQSAIWNAGNTGVSLGLTHVQIGSGNKATIDGLETSLVSPQQAVAIAAGSRISNSQIRMSAIFTGENTFNIAEVGLWAGSPSESGSLLVAYWSQEFGNLAVKSAGVDFVFSHDMYLNGSVPDGSITILADQDQSFVLSALANHEAKSDPHPQYTTSDEALALISAAVSNLVNASPASLDTLKELAAALGDDANFATNVTNVLAGKAPLGGAGATGTWGISITGTAGGVAWENVSGKPTALSQFTNDLSMFVAGMSMRWPSATPPAGWLIRNGAAISRTAYASLFNVIGTTFGAGNGSTTFNLPDDRDRMTIGAGNIYGVGATGGSRDAIVVSHSHAATTSAGDYGHAHSETATGYTGADGSDSFTGGGQVNISATTSVGYANIWASTTISASGQSGAGANLPPYIADYGIIKY